MKKLSNLTNDSFFGIILLFLCEGGTMKKVNKLGLLLASLGVFMISLAGILQYHAFKLENNNNSTLKISMQDVNTGHVEEINNNVVEDKNENENTETNDTVDTINEVANVVEEIEITEELEDVKTYEEISTVPVEPIVYDNMTLNQLAEKLNKSLKSTLAGKGYLIASYSLELGVDPYLATAIMLHETGCNGTCSTLVRECNNVGGQKGGPSCGGGAYKAYPTLDKGIIGYLDNLYRNYYAMGLNTVETIGPKYAASTTWASKVNYYINLIKSR